MRKGSIAAEKASKVKLGTKRNPKCNAGASVGAVILVDIIAPLTKSYAKTDTNLSESMGWQKKLIIGKSIRRKRSFCPQTKTPFAEPQKALKLMYKR